MVEKDCSLLFMHSLICLVIRFRVKRVLFVTAMIFQSGIITAVAKTYICFIDSVYISLVELTTSTSFTRDERNVDILDISLQLRYHLYRNCKFCCLVILFYYGP